MRTTTPRQKLRKVWNAMIKRCTNPADPAFKNYGGRGISVDPLWLSFDAFFADMGIPQPGMMLERIDNNGPYSPTNCEWAPRSVQNRNKRSNRLITNDGITLCLKDWANKLGLSESFIRRRMDVQGMTFEEAISKPKRYSVWRKSRAEAERGLR